MAKYHKKKGLVFVRSDNSKKHPLNIILKLLFKMFQARYIVENYHKKLKEREAEQEEERKKREEALLAAQLIKSSDGPDSSDDDSDDDFAMSEVPESPIRLPFRAVHASAPPIEPPPKETMELMKECRFHGFFRNCLKRWAQLYEQDDIGEYEWDRNDKLDIDRLKHYVQSERKLVTNDPTERPTKSARTDHEMPKALKLPLDGRTA